MVSIVAKNLKACVRLIYMNKYKKLMLWSFFGPIGIGLLSFVIIQIIVVIQGGECISSTAGALFRGLQPFGTQSNVAPSTFCKITNTLAIGIMPRIALLSGVFIAPGIIAGIIFFFIGRSKKAS
jgi:hypothetical protein